MAPALQPALVPTDLAALPPAAVRVVREALLQRLGNLAEARGEGCGENKRVIPLVGLDTELQDVAAFVRGIVRAHENSSLLLVGARGSGRHATLAAAFDLLRAETRTGNNSEPFKVVMLHGSTLSDDAAALREISRQLAIDTHLLDGVGKVTTAPRDVMSPDGGASKDSGAANLAAPQVNGMAHVTTSFDIDEGAPSEGATGSLSSSVKGVSDARGIRRLAERHCPGLLRYVRSACADADVNARVLRASGTLALSLLPGLVTDDCAKVLLVPPAAAHGRVSQSCAVCRVAASSTGARADVASGAALLEAAASSAATVSGMVPPQCACGDASVASASSNKETVVTTPTRKRGRTTTTSTASSPAVPSRATRSAYEAHLAFVVSSLRDGRAASVPVFIVVDDFDAFARRPVQSLLYNLLDLTQAGSVHLGVIGITTRVDVLGMLEKRLRSRFSHRSVNFAGLRPAYLSRLVAAALEFPEGLAERLAPLAITGGSNSTAVAEALAKYPAAWNAAVATLVASSSTTAALRVAYARGTALRAIFRAVQTTIARAPELMQADIAAAVNRAAISSRTNVLPLLPPDAFARSIDGSGDASLGRKLRFDSLSNLSLVEVQLVIAAAHAEMRHEATYGAAAGASYGGGGSASTAAAGDGSRAGLRTAQYNLALLVADITSHFASSSGAMMLAARGGTSGTSMLTSTAPASAAAAGEDTAIAGVPTPARTLTASHAATAHLPSHYSRWMLDGRVARRAMLSLLMRDVFRVIPRTGGAAAGCGGLPQWTSITLIGRERGVDHGAFLARLLHEPLVLLVEPELVIAAVRGALGNDLPSDVRQWALRGGALAPVV